MADATKIEWADSTFNPWMGCTKVGPGCDHCYAETMMDTRLGHVQWGAGKPRVRTSAANWRKPLQWNAKPFYQCTGCGWRGDEPEGAGCPSCHSMQIVDARRRVFCASLSDWLDNEVPIEWLVDLLDLIRITPNLDWLLLTKRIGNWHKRITEAHQQVVRQIDQNNGAERVPALWDLGIWLQDWIAGKPPANVWIGATVVNQEEADRDIPKLLRVSARVRFLSIEPMRGPIDLGAFIAGHESAGTPFSGARTVGGCEEWTPPLDWVIAGGESGPNARPSHPDWYRDLRDQCASAGVPLLFKQWGAWSTSWGMDAKTCLIDINGRTAETLAQVPSGSTTSEQWQSVYLHPKKAAGRLLDGIEHNGFPESA